MHVNLWLIHINVRQKPLQYCKVISLQLIKINEKKRKQGTKKRRKVNKREYDIYVWSKLTSYEEVKF